MRKFNRDVADWTGLTVTKITTLYSCSKHKSIIECTTYRTSSRASYNSISHKQKAENAKCTGLPKTDREKLEKQPGLIKLLLKHKDAHKEVSILNKDARVSLKS